MLRPAGRRAPAGRPSAQGPAGNSWTADGGCAPPPRTWSHSPAHLPSPREGQVPASRPGDRGALAPAPRRSRPRPAHVSRRHCASASLAARPAATDLRPQQSLAGGSGLARKRAEHPGPGDAPTPRATVRWQTRRTQRAPAPCGAVLGWAWGASTAPGRGAPGRPGRCRCVNWSR